MWTWIGNNWAYVALAVSEILPFLPIKVSGIVQAAFAFIAQCLGKAK